MARVDKILQGLKKQGWDSALVTSTGNFFYVTNYYTDPHERVIAAFIHQQTEPVIVVPAMEAEDAKACGWPYQIIGYEDHENPWHLLQQELDKRNIAPENLAIEWDHVTIERHEAIKEIFPKTKLHDGKELLAQIRVIKDEEEYSRLKQAAALADYGVEIGVKAIQEGVSEIDIVAEIEYQLKKRGVQGMSFSTMVLSGTKTASPHGTPSAKKITAGDLVLFDLGVIVDGYCSDITRTVAFQTISSEQKKIYETVLQAQETAIETSNIGVPAGDIDKAARDVIAKAGYGKYFNHRIGHGLGIETHEYPSMHQNNTLPLKPGMCYTIEPGIYQPGVGGVRIEDMIFVTKSGIEILTKYPKELTIIS